jgi:uncharacterized protein YejL (UPF0352 family)
MPTTATQDQTNTLQLVQQFLASQQQMQAECAAQDDQLRQLVAQMNAAPADQKLDVMAAIVNKLVEDRVAAHQRKEALKDRILQALIGPGATGTNGVPPQGTSQPPTMSPPPGSSPAQPIPAPAVPPR